MQDEDRAKQGLNEVPSSSDMNAMLARSPNELQLFERMDAEMPWIAPSSGQLPAPHRRRLKAHQMCALQLLDLSFGVARRPGNPVYHMRVKQGALHVEKPSRLHMWQD